MSDPEKAMAFQRNKMALASAELNQKARILALADRLDLMLTAESSLADWEANSIATGPTLLISPSYLGTVGTVILSTIL